MLHRRVFLASLSAGLASWSALSSARLRADPSSLKSPGVHVEIPLPGEDLFAYIRRIHGDFHREHYLRLLGAANEFKEGDEIIGVAAADDTLRLLEQLLSA